jgi:hypothetical protein
MSFNDWKPAKKSKSKAYAELRNALKSGLTHPEEGKNMAAILLRKARNDEDPNQMVAAKLALEYAFGKPGSMDQEEIKRRAEVRALEIVELKLREARARLSIELAEAKEVTALEPMPREPDTVCQSQDPSPADTLPSDEQKS